MDLPDIEKVNEEQAAFGAGLGLALEGQPLGVALARIHDVVQERFLGLRPRGPTLRQLELLSEWGLADGIESIGVASAMIDCGLRQLDRSAMRGQQLEPGVTVVSRRDPERRCRIISSITPWGLVYFKGAKAPARDLERVWRVGTGSGGNWLADLDREPQPQLAEHRRSLARGPSVPRPPRANVALTSARSRCSPTSASAIGLALRLALSAAFPSSSAAPFLPAPRAARPW